jgi:hypothetical protein
MFKRTSRKSAEPNDAEPKAAKTKEAKKKAPKVKAPKPQAVEPSEPQIYRRPVADVYTVMLSVGLVATILATVALWMVMKDYDYAIKGGPTPAWNHPAVPAVVETPHALV